MVNVPSRIIRPLQTPTTNGPRLFSISSSPLTSSIHQRSNSRRLRLVTSTLSIKAVTSLRSQNGSTKELKSARIRQRINGLCLQILGISGTGTVTSSTSNGWTFWNFKQPNGRHTRTIVVAVDGGYVQPYPPSPGRSSIGVWFGNGTAEFGSPYNISRRVTSQASRSDEAELVAATEGLLKLYGIYSSNVREKDTHAIIKTDLRTIPEKMNLYISTKGPITFKRLPGPQVHWRNLIRALELVQSLGVKVGFWHVLRDKNRFADALATHALVETYKPFHLTSFKDIQRTRDEDIFVVVVGKHQSRNSLRRFFTRWCYRLTLAFGKIQSWLSLILMSRVAEKSLAQSKPQRTDSIRTITTQSGSSHLKSDSSIQRHLRLQRPCFSWNHSISCKEDPCPYPHQCSVCKGDHHKLECPNYDSTREACGRWNTTTNNCVLGSCDKQHICAYCAGPHLVGACSIKPPGSHWSCVNETCPTRLPNTQSHCISCGSPRPRSAFSSHTRGPDEQSCEEYPRAKATRRKELASKKTRAMNESMSETQPRQGGQKNMEEHLPPRPSDLKPNDPRTPRVFKRFVPVSSRKSLAVRKASQENPSAQPHSVPRSQPQVLKRPQSPTPQPVVPTYQEPLPSLVTAQAEPKSYFSPAKVLGYSAFRNLPRGGRTLRKRK